jgi:hypothetical protein
MYRKDNKQITIDEYIYPFGKLNQSNRWVKKSSLIPWDAFEEKYSEKFSDSEGAPAKPFRMALGALIIKQEMGVSDEETVEQILENPYLQYFIGLHSFTNEAPFAATMMVYFRKRITNEILCEINETMFRKASAEDMDDKDNGKPGGKGNTSETLRKTTATEDQHPKQGDALPVSPNTEKTTEPENKGTIINDATCMPADIRYPRDIDLLNEAREKLEGIIDTLYEYSDLRMKPRTYRNSARRDYLRFIKLRKPGAKRVRKAIGQQLRYVSRDLKHIELLAQHSDETALSKNQEEWLETIKKLWVQQDEMYKNKKHQVDDRIVSISQPYVRPIVRGKVKAPVEFGAKVSISVVSGYVFVDKLSWDAYNEETDLVGSIKNYKEKYGFYPKVVLADKIYRSRKNRAFCKEHGIRLSGPALGRPPVETDLNVIKQERFDSGARNAVEGKFGEGKTGYGLGLIKAHLKETSETVIMLGFFCMNLSKLLRAFCTTFSEFIVCYFKFRLNLPELIIWTF